MGKRLGRDPADFGHVTGVAVVLDVVAFHEGFAGVNWGPRAVGELDEGRAQDVHFFGGVGQVELLAPKLGNHLHLHVHDVVVPGGAVFHVLFDDKVGGVQPRAFVFGGQAAVRGQALQHGFPLFSVVQQVFEHGEVVFAVGAPERRHDGAQFVGQAGGDGEPPGRGVADALHGGGQVFVLGVAGAGREGRR